MEQPLSVVALKSIWKDLNSMQHEAIDGIALRVNEENLHFIEADITGPENTAYEGGIFPIRLVFDGDYPNTPPKGYFLTKIFHPNISNKGEICVNTLKKDWDKNCGLKHVLMVIRCLLIEPNPESALNMDAGHLLLENYDEFCQRAKLFTQLYAMKDSSKENVPLVPDVDPSRRPSSPVSAKSTSSVLSNRSDNSNAANGSPKKKKEVEKKKSLKRL